MQGMLGRLLQIAVDDNANVDLHDRALLYYRLLTRDPSCATAASIIAPAAESAVRTFCEELDTDVKEKIFSEFNSLSVVYGQPSEQFIAEDKQSNERDVYSANFFSPEQ